ncbi:endonuclease domain-containing protein [Gryllotalpicola koreensis]|uniref:DUF559 domain-containing protein n=1 Tax=Gryllotalpicola koreensis TaxID=993086 RepID=A0ABP8A4W6_9MICO
MDLDRILDLNQGFTTRAALYSAGFSKRRIQEELSAGRIVAYGKLLVGRPTVSPAFRRAATMRARLACITAAKSMGLWTLETDAFHVVPPASNSHVHPDGRLPRARVHWSSSPIEPDRSRLVVESGRNALAHIADCQPIAAAVATFDSAVRKGLVSVEELQRLASVRRGRFARVVALVSDHADSGLESLTRVRLLWEGVACREQVVIDGHPVDLLIGDRLIIQLDGKQHLEDPEQLERDRWQDRRLRRMGYTVLRYSYDDVVANWPTTWAEIRSHLAQSAHLA